MAAFCLGSGGLLKPEWFGCLDGLGWLGWRGDISPAWPLKRAELAPEVGSVLADARELAGRRRVNDTHSAVGSFLRGKRVERDKLNEHFTGIAV
jgi:hypothetical protein